MNRLGEQDDPAAIVGRLERRVDTVLESTRPRVRVEEVGRITSVGEGVAMVAGLPGVGADELLLLGDRIPGWAFDVTEDRVGVVLLGSATSLSAGDEVRRMGRPLDVPVGPALLGRVVDA
ncbi:MAG: hypothetical protein KDA22_10295, partial [Phycisphaerales bacterium]|nr:hypothetical protein [Phycisphaerales bacterium]